MKRNFLSLILIATVLLAVSGTAQLIETSKPAPTAAELAAQSVVEAMNAEILHRVKIHEICWNTIWKNERPGATPAAVLAALGTKAGLIFAFASENIDHIDRIAKLVGKTRADFIKDEDCVPPAAFTVHADGRVTLD